jgi:hypothetical protein
MSDKQAEVKGHEWIQDKKYPNIGVCSCQPNRDGFMNKLAWQAHLASLAALASQVPAQPPAPRCQYCNMGLHPHEPSDYMHEDYCKKNPRFASAPVPAQGTPPAQPGCKLCREGIPLKKYFDGSMRHFDGFMAWTKCESAYVRTQSRAFVSGFKAAIELAAQQAHCGDECTSSNILRLGIAEAIRAISIPPIADDAAPVPAQGTPPAQPDICPNCHGSRASQDGGTCCICEPVGHLHEPQSVPDSDKTLAVSAPAPASPQVGETLEFRKPGEIVVNTPGCDKCGKIFLDCQCASLYEEIIRLLLRNANREAQANDIANFIRTKLRAALDERDKAITDYLSIQKRLNETRFSYDNAMHKKALAEAALAESDARIASLQSESDKFGKLFHKESGVTLDLAEMLREAGTIARAEAMEEAATILLDEVSRHRESSGPHNFCEDYGCYSLERMANDIRALAAQPTPAPKEEENG